MTIYNRLYHIIIYMPQCSNENVCQLIICIRSLYPKGILIYVRVRLIDYVDTLDEYIL